MFVFLSLSLSVYMHGCMRILQTGWKRRRPFYRMEHNTRVQSECFLDKFQQYFQSEIFCCTFSKMSTFLQKSAIAFAKMKGAEGEGGGLAVWKKSKNHLVWNHQPDSCVKVVALIQGGFSFSWFCSKSVVNGKILSKKVKVQASHFLPVVPLLSIFWEVFCHLQHLLERTSKKNHPVSI